MGISAYRETTDWDCPNHTYLFDGNSNILAYAVDNGPDIHIFKVPLPLSTKGRKFVKVSHKQLDAYGKTVQVKKEKSNHPSWTVKSSSGSDYIVQLIDGKYRCNCVGYAYRGKCKHSMQIQSEQTASK